MALSQVETFCDGIALSFMSPFNVEQRDPFPASRSPAGLGWKDPGSLMGGDQGGLLMVSRVAPRPMSCKTSRDKARYFWPGGYSLSNVSSDGLKWSKLRCNKQDSRGDYAIPKIVSEGYDGRDKVVTELPVLE